MYQPDNCLNFLANEAEMENEAVSVNDVLHNNGDIEWQPLALTLVEYPKGKVNINFPGLILLYSCSNNDSLYLFSGDWLGKFFALISLSPFGIGAGFVALILFRRDLHTVSLDICFDSWQCHNYRIFI